MISVAYLPKVNKKKQSKIHMSKDSKGDRWTPLSLKNRNLLLLQLIADIYLLFLLPSGLAL